ncbi:hypothetical protein [Streptomyces incanus]|uniref:hypothetical protein n=1 Tax=Streptomyces incanus TaxID=887453 RepID=UPI0036D41683
MVAQEKIKLKPVTAADRHSMPHYEVPEDADPLALLSSEREEGDCRSQGLIADCHADDTT